MENLQKQIDDLTASALEFKNNGNENKYNAIMDKVEQLKRYQAERKQQAEQVEQTKKELIEAAIVETSEVVDTLEIMPGLTLRDVITDPEAYQLVSIAFKTELNAKDAKYIKELTEERRSASERETNLQYQLKERDKNIDSLNEVNAELRKQVNTLTFERDKAFEYRDNAAAEVDGLRLLVEEKDKHIETLRAEIAIGAKGAQQVDQTEQLKKAHEDWINSRIKVTNIRWTDEIKQREYAAELVMDCDSGKAGETITFNRLDKGFYLEISQEEAIRFRAEQAAKANIEAAATVQDIPLVEEAAVPVVGEVKQFREEAGFIVDEGHQVADEQQGVQLQAQTIEDAFRLIGELSAEHKSLKVRVDILQLKMGV